MEKNKLQVGTELIAINECVMNQTAERALIIGKKYPIVSFTEDEEDITEMAIVIIDEQNEEHLFSKSDLEKYFTL